MNEYTRVAYEHGALVVAAAGNAGNRIYNYPGTKKHKGFYPASFPWVMSVGGLSHTSKYTIRHDKSNYGKIDISAPYDNVFTTTYSKKTNAKYAFVTGTSFSAPMVSGLASLIFSLRPNYTPDQVRSTIQSTATDLGATGKDEDTGHGRINMEAALESVKFKINAGVTGLNSSGLILRLNGVEDLPVDQNGQTSFTSTFSNRSSYDVIILSQPGSEFCDIYNGSGFIDRDDVRNIFLSCYDVTDITPPGDIENFTTAGVECGGVQLSWSNPTDYDLLGAILVRNKNHSPQNPGDGEELVNTTIITSENIDFSDASTTYTDLFVNQGERYYYTMFTLDTANNISSGNSVTAIAPTPQESCTVKPAGGGGGGCFIATAAFGTEFMSDVVLLRKFRDQYLLKRSWGVHFVDLYYKYSPNIANRIQNSLVLKPVVRFLLKPFVAISALSIREAAFNHYMVLFGWTLFVTLIFRAIYTKTRFALRRKDE